MQFQATSIWIYIFCVCVCVNCVCVCVCMCVCVCLCVCVCVCERAHTQVMQFQATETVPDGDLGLARVDVSVSAPDSVLCYIILLHTRELCYVISYHTILYHVMLYITLCYVSMSAPDSVRAVCWTMICGATPSEARCSARCLLQLKS